MLRKIVLAAAFFALSLNSSFAASRVWITEFDTLSSTSTAAPAQAAQMPSVARQALDISGGVQASAAFNGRTLLIRIICEVQCAVRGDGGTATSSDILLPALTPEYFGVQPAKTISVIAAP